MRRSIKYAVLGLVLLSGASVDAYDLKNVRLESRTNQFIAYADIWGYTAPGGDEYCIIGTKWGTAFYDMTIPSSPRYTGFVGGPKSSWRDAKVYRDYCYVTTEGGGTGEGLQIIDLSDPDNPTLVSTYTATFTSAHNVYIDTAAGHAYVCGASGGTHILDLSDPVNPVEVGLISSPYLHDIMARDGVLYGGAIGSGQLRMWDVSTPSNPVPIGARSTPGGSTHNVWPTDNGQYVLTTDETANGDLRIYDVTNLQNISEVASYRTGPSGSIIHNVHVRGDVAFISYYTEGMRLLDVSDPTAPVEIGFDDTFLATATGFKGCWGIYPYAPSGAVYGSDIRNGLFTIFYDESFGNVSGDVSSSLDATPLADVSISIASVGFSQRSFDDGLFSIHETPGSHSIRFERHGYATEIVPTTFTTGLDTTISVAMTPLPTGTISGTVKTTGGTPIAGAFVELIGPAIVPIQEYSDTTDGSGNYSLPSSPIGGWEVRATVLGRTPGVEPAVVSDGGTTTTDFFLTAAIFSDDFEADNGWTIGAPGDNATDGIWERTLILGKESGRVVPSFDHTPGSGTDAFFTERGDLFESVDLNEVNGTTSLLSPIIDLTGTDNPVVSYWRFHSVNAGPFPFNGDAFVVKASSDGGSSWTTVDSLTTNLIHLGAQWRNHEFTVNDFVPLTSTFLVKFVITDQGDDSIVESGVDDFSVYEGPPTFTSVASGDVSNGSVTPVRTVLMGNRPNPFNPSTSIRFQIAERSRVTLELYDIAGRLVRTLVSGVREGGSHEVTWNGNNDAGGPAPSGVYFYRLRSGESVDTQKLTLIR